MPALTSIALGLGALGGIAGGISGASGSTQTSTKNVAAPGAVEQGLQQDSLNNYNDAQNLVGQQENNLGSAQDYQDQSQGVNSNILNGSQFNLSPQQQAQIDSIRNASITAGQGDIQNFVNQNLGGVISDAANRGLRGQALSDLQGKTINEGTRQYTNLVNQANATAAQQSLDTPYRQAQLQSSVASQGMSYADQLRQQAINNRNTLQNPALMNTLQNERLASASTTTNTPGNFGSVAGGILGGIGSGFGAAGGLVKAAGYDSSGSGGSNYYGTPTSSDNFTLPSSGSSSSPFHLAHGGFVPGSSNFRGDNMGNDTVSAKLSPGEIVIPRSHAHDPKLAKAYIDYLHKKDQPNWRA